MKIPLPIDSMLDSIVSTMISHPITVVQAPPGSGKTTRVGPAMVISPAFNLNQRIYLLQPRRLAAKSVAERIAQENGWWLGREVGYQVRFEKVYHRDTRLVVATEGVLLRRLQDDATLADISVIVMDEFHERSIDSDLILGMLRQLQSTVRDDLRIVIMSATLDATTLAARLNHAPVLVCEGRSFPVTIRYRPPRFGQNLVDSMTDNLTDVVSRTDGDILAFLPGQGEIHRVHRNLAQQQSLQAVEVHSLYGGLPLEQQTRIIQPGPRQKIVLATNVAETSLTIEGIRVVVDSGYARVMRFDPAVGLDRLSLEPIAQDSATQRAGRAGRTQEGICYRLWDENSHRSRPSSQEPEIRRVDLASAVLRLYQWGEPEVLNFPWLTPPRPEAVEAAIALLEKLGAIEGNRLSIIGQQLIRLPLHPRLARMVVAGKQLGVLGPVARAAAMLSERDPFQKANAGETAESRPTTIRTQGNKRWLSDVTIRLELLEDFLRNGRTETPLGRMRRHSVSTIMQAASDIERSACAISFQSLEAFENVESMDVETKVRLALLRGFPDRVARKRSSDSKLALMVGGKAVQLDSSSGVHDAEFFLCVDLDVAKSGPNATVRQASAIESTWLVGKLRESRDELFFHPSQQQVVARRRDYWDDLLLNETPTSIEDREAAADLLFQQAKLAWSTIFPRDDQKVISLIERCRWLKALAPEVDLPDLSEEALQSIGRELCSEFRSFSELKKAPWYPWILARFSAEQMKVLDREAPASIQVPSGSTIRLEYTVGKPPVLPVKIQEVFSWKQTPRLGFGKVPLLLHLLAPNQRPQQVTDDLASFWATGYHQIKKELKRRYPKHAWPDDPSMASPSKK